MATQLDEFPTDSGRRGIYDWPTLLNGQPWEAKRGSKEQVKAGTHDYSVSGRSFRSAAQQAAERAGGYVKTRVLDGGERVALRFFKDEETAPETTPDDAA